MLLPVLKIHQVIWIDSLFFMLIWLWFNHPRYSTRENVCTERDNSKHVYWLIAYVTISTSTFQDYFWVTIDYMLWGVVVNFTIFRIVVTASFCIPTKNGIPTIIWIYPVFSKFTNSPVSDIGMDRTVRARDESAQGDKCPKLSSKKKHFGFKGYSYTAQYIFVFHVINSSFFKYVCPKEGAPTPCLI